MLEQRGLIWISAFLRLFHKVNPTWTAAFTWTCPLETAGEQSRWRNPTKISTLVAQVLVCSVSWLQFSQDHCSHHKQLTQKISNKAILPHPLLLPSQYTEMLKTNQMCHIRLFCDKTLRRLLLSQPVLDYQKWSVHFLKLLCKIAWQAQVLGRWFPFSNVTFTLSWWYTTLIKSIKRKFSWVGHVVHDSIPFPPQALI